MTTFYPRRRRYTVTDPAGTVLYSEERSHDLYTAPHERDLAASLVCNAALAADAPDGRYACAVEGLCEGTGAGSLGPSWTGTAAVDRAGISRRGRARLSEVKLDPPPLLGPSVVSAEPGHDCCLCGAPATTCDLYDDDVPFRCAEHSA